MSKSFKIDFVGIGASKSGTTWLGHVLAEHPEICMSEPKEVHFFNDRLTFRNKLQERNYSKGLDWYQKHFRHCAEGMIKGEITPRYSTDSLAAARIRDHNKDIKLLYCLREPVDRIESHYNFAKHYVGKEDRPMDQAVREETEYIDMTRYGSNLAMYLTLFDRSQICIIWFDDIKDKPQTVLREVYSFLGVNPGFVPPSLHSRSNPARASKSIGFELFLRRVKQQFIQIGLSGVVHLVKRSPVKDWVMKWNSKPLQKEKVPVETRQFIRDTLREDILQLQALTGRDLSHWLKADP